MMRFRFRNCLICSVLVAVAPPIWPQTDRLENDLNTAYKGKILLVRNFYSGNDLTYDQNGHLQTPSTTGAWTLANVRVTHIRVSPQSIEVDGNRMGTLYKNGKPNLVDVGKLKLRINKPTSDGDTEAVVRPVFDAIFVGPDENLVPLLPNYWQSYLVGNDLNSRLAAWRALLEKGDPTAGAPSKVSPGTVSPPHPLSYPDPKYTKEAASLHIEGISKLIVVVGASGSPENIAIMGPLGMGLDEQAVSTVRQWRFQPAMKDGQPVRVQININITFRCCP